MKLFAATVFGMALMSAPAFAESHASGDAEAGEKGFNRCKACHAIVDADGEVILKGGRTGPNLYGLNARKAGTVEDFAGYGDALVEAGEKGLEWDESNFVEYVADPKKFLVEHNDDKRAKSKMSFKLKKEEDAKDIWAYLVSVGPEV